MMSVPKNVQKLLMVSVIGSLCLYQYHYFFGSSDVKSQNVQEFEQSYEKLGSASFSDKIADTSKLQNNPSASNEQAPANYKQERQPSVAINFTSNDPEVRRLTRQLFVLLEDLDITILKKSPPSKIYGNIFSGKGSQQVEGYIAAVRDFQKKHPIKTICEIGFAGGHSATVFLSTTEGASYTAFDMWDRAVYEDAALAWVKQQFPEREITLVKGDSTKTVPTYQGTCDLIHIDGAHHANFPITDMKNMVRLASENNLLLMDDCSKSWPAVLKGVDYLKKNDLVHTLDMHIAEGWIFRGAQKGWCIGSYKKTPVVTVPKTLKFLGKEICNPPSYGSNCEQKSNEPCSKSSDRCFYNDESGTISVSCERWHGAQSVEQVTWDTRPTATDRNEAHAKSFDYYKSLPSDLGDMIELGAGPFTQSQTILQDRSASSITLIEPMAFHYITNVKLCYYKNGTFKNLPTTLLSIPAEELDNSRKFDTLVMINVIEHVYDALSILNSAVNLIKDNGLFIWHERLWDNYKGKANYAGDREFQLHPIRIKKTIAQHLMSVFNEVYVTWDTEELRRLKNQGVYFIGRKKSGNFKTEIPKHPACFKQITGKQSVVFFVSNQNVTDVVNQLDVVKSSPNVKSVMLILTEAMLHESLQGLLKFDKIKAMVSHHHLADWQNQVRYYTQPCMNIVNKLTSDMLNGSETVCVGSS